MLLLILLIACAHPPLPPPEPVAAAAPPNVAEEAAPSAVVEVAPNVVGASGLRFDGVYQSTAGNPSKGWTYIRFYPDAIAIEVGSTGTPADLQPWFGREREDLSQGRWTLDGDHLTLPVKSPEGIVLFEGMIDPQGRLRMHWRSEINGAEGDDVLVFVPWT